jgi:outer membrane protein TolC
LAAAENKSREMVDHYTKAAAAADELVKSTQAAYNGGRVDLDALLTALKTQAQLKVTLASLRR